MSYVSLVKNIPGMLTQPTGIAALASLGIHGAIALIVPLMPVNSSSSAASNSPKTVGLMELNAMDQSRLPQNSENTQIALQNQLPAQNQLPPQHLLGTDVNNYSTAYPPIDPKFAAELNNQPVLPVIPSSASNYNLPALPQQQSLTSNSTTNSSTKRYNNSNYTTKNLDRHISSLKARTAYSPYDTAYRENINTEIRETETLPINRLPQVSSNTEIPAEVMKNPTPDAIDIGSSTASAENVPLTNIPQISQNEEKLAMGSQNLPQNLALENQSASAKVKVNTVNNSNVNNTDAKAKINEKILDNLKSFNSLREDVKQQFPNVKEKGVIRETIATNTSDMQGMISGRLVVDADGKIVDIKFQEGSGSAKLQAKAREFFKANPPQADQKVVTSYPFQLQFKNQSGSVGEILKTKPVSVPIEQKVSIPENTPQKKVTPSENTKAEVNTLSVNSQKPVPTATASSTEEFNNSVNNSSEKVESVESNNSSNKSSEKLLEKLREIRQERQNN